MTEGILPTLAQTRQLHRSLTEKVLDKAASDPQWKQQLIDDPEAAMRAANFPEAQQLEQMRASAGAAQEGEVTGQHLFWEPGRVPVWECHFWTTKWEVRYY